MSEGNSNHVRGLFGIYFALMALLVLTVGMARIDLGPLNIVIAMLIAVVKAALVILVFMHVIHSGKLVWIFASATFVWLGIMLVLTFSDYLTRSDIPRGDPFNENAPFAHSVEHHAAQPKG